MANSSLEYLVEAVLIDLLRADPRLSGNRFFHFDESDKAKSNVIIVQATEGEKRLDGDRSSNVKAEVEYRSATATKASNDVVASAMQEAIYNATPAGSASLSRFERFTVLSESDGTRENTKSLRKRTRVFPIIAKLK